MREDQQCKLFSQSRNLVVEHEMAKEQIKLIQGKKGRSEECATGIFHSSLKKPQFTVVIENHSSVTHDSPQ